MALGTRRGGTAVASPAGISDAETIQRSGARTSTAPPTRAACSRTAPAAPLMRPPPPPPAPPPVPSPPPALQPLARAVDPGGLVEALRDVLEPGDEDDHVDAEVLQHREQDDGGHGPGGIAERVDRTEPDQREPPVQEAEAGVVEVAPDDRNRDQRGHHGQEEDRPEEAAEARQPGVHEERRAERDGDGERAADEDEVERVAERDPEARVAQEGCVVVPADHPQVARVADGVDVEVREAQEQRGDDRREEEDADQAERRRHEPDGGTDPPAPRHRASAWPRSQRRFASIASTFPSSAASASSAVMVPRTAASACRAISVAIRSHSGIFGVARTASSCVQNAPVYGSRSSAASVPALRRAGRSPVSR